MHSVLFSVTTQSRLTCRREILKRSLVQVGRNYLFCLPLYLNLLGCKCFIEAGCSMSRNTKYLLKVIGFESSRRHLYRLKNGGEKSIREKRPYIGLLSVSGGHMLAASEAGILTLFMTNPIWVVKTRWETENSFLKSSAQGVNGTKVNERFKTLKFIWNLSVTGMSEIATRWNGTRNCINRTGVVFKIL